MTKEKTLNLIVLDFNGTLFPDRFIITETGADPVLVTLINRLCERENFKIVISSQQQAFGEAACAKELAKAGISPSYLADDGLWRTLSAGFAAGDRYRQIERWYQQHKDSIKNLIIFDDDRCSMVSELMAFWFRCDEQNGISRVEVLDLCAQYPSIAVK